MRPNRRSTGEPFYVNAASGDSSYDRPPPLAAAAAEGGLVAEKPRWQRQREMARQRAEAKRAAPAATENVAERAAQVEDAPAGVAAADRPRRVAHGEAGQEARDEPALPTGWSSTVSQSTGRLFYVNTSTGYSTYTRPTSEASATGAHSSTAAGGQNAGQSAPFVYAALRTEATQVAPEAERGPRESASVSGGWDTTPHAAARGAEHPLKPSIHSDPPAAPPDGLADAVLPALLAAAAAAGLAEGAVDGAMDADEPRAALLGLIQAHRETEAAEARGSAGADALPPGWDTAVSRSTGQEFYVSGGDPH
jgi:hypothetical protein